MHTRAGEPGGLGGVVSAVADRARSLARLEAELAVAELRAKAKPLGAGAALGAATAVAALFALGFAFAAAAAALALVLPLWAALLIVAGGLLVLAAVLGAVARASVRRASPPVPERAVAEARRTAVALRQPE
jgi:hypothetical protein